MATHTDEGPGFWGPPAMRMWREGAAAPDGAWVEDPTWGWLPAPPGATIELWVREDCSPGEERTTAQRRLRLPSGALVTEGHWDFPGSVEGRCPRGLVLVTRHVGLVEALRELGAPIPDGTRVIAHASVEDIRGHVVWGVLPLSMASHAREVVEVTLAMAPEDRGKELTATEVLARYQGVARYRVQRV